MDQKELSQGEFDRCVSKADADKWAPIGKTQSSLRRASLPTCKAILEWVGGRLPTYEEWPRRCGPKSHVFSLGRPNPAQGRASESKPWSFRAKGGKPDRF